MGGAVQALPASAGFQDTLASLATLALLGLQDFPEPEHLDSLGPPDTQAFLELAASPESVDSPGKVSQVFQESVEPPDSQGSLDFQG